jgi:hypothetical protein
LLGSVAGTFPSSGNVTNLPLTCSAVNSPDWKGQDGGVYDRDNSGKYKIKRFNPPDKDGKPAKGIKSDYCVDMMALRSRDFPIER